MDLQVQHLADGIDRVRLVGRLDSTGVELIDPQLNLIGSGGSSRVVLDLSQVSFLASVGIRSLLTTARALRRHGGRMALLSPQSIVEEVLKVTGIENIIPIFHDLESASAALKAPATSA